MSTAMPQIPPRPTRAQEQKKASGSSLGSDLPKIPPRPANRRLDRSISPQRESFAQSPLNETPFTRHGNQSKSSISSEDVSGSDQPRRPSSVVLPSLGQEGSEYAEVVAATEDLSSSPTQTRNIANDLKLHAPKPSLPSSAATRRVSTVTRTDSGQAAALGLGAAPDDKELSSRPLKTRDSFASQTSNSAERPPSSTESEHGIPEIGQRVPMYPDAGDVQAPSPSPYTTPYAPGIGFHNDGSKPRHHSRRTSGRSIDIPFDAYGKHGHGQIPHDRFEKAYYEKHPELLKKETSLYHGPYAEDRPEWAMSSEDLNKIVRDTASRGAGIGTSPAIVGTPSEQIGFQASEEYASRISSPRPQSSAFHLAHSNASQTHVDSPLRKESTASEFDKKADFEGAISKRLDGHGPSDTGLESEVEDDDVIHVEDPNHRHSIYGGAGRLESTEDLGHHTGGEDDGFLDENGYSAPILAPDEVAKEPFGWELQPAVSPLHERRGSAFDEYSAHLRSGSASSSRPTSRPASIHGNVPGIRLPSDRPLEALDEYEPLFSEEEGNEGGKDSGKDTLATADRLKRPELKNRKFPSQDIWEDTPNSLQYTATVSTPQLPEEKEGETKLKREQEVETPEQAFARRQEELAEQESDSSHGFLDREKRPWSHASPAVTESRPSSESSRLGTEFRHSGKQRFPSRDIWEDTPDSLQLQTTVGGPQSDDKDALSPPSERPTAGAVANHQEKAAAGLPLGSEEGRATTGIAAPVKPQIPARPTRAKPSESPERTQHPPPLPTKSKPQVPARPSKPTTRDSSENVPLTTVPSNSSAKSTGSDQGVAAKPKPPVPSRPVGSKIAALQSGFMLDLNKRLQLGPQAPKKEEPAAEEVVEEKEKAPLVDARKGRARGPARRAPAKSPAPASAPAVEKPQLACAVSVPSTLWQIDPDEDLLLVPSHPEEVAPKTEADVSAPKPETKAAQSETPTLATNMAGEPVHEASEIAPGSENAASQPSPTEDAHAEHLEDAQAEALSNSAYDNELEPIKSSDKPPVVSQSTDASENIDDEALAASTDTLKPRTEDNVE